jgi:type IV pilus biogenesis protein CpaD/CtpE
MQRREEEKAHRILWPEGKIDSNASRRTRAEFVSRFFALNRLGIGTRKINSVGREPCSGSFSATATAGAVRVKHRRPAAGWPPSFHDGKI